MREPPYVILRRSLHTLSSAEVYDETPLNSQSVRKRVKLLRMAERKSDHPSWWYFSQRVDRVPAEKLFRAWKPTWDIHGWWASVMNADDA